MNTKKIWDEELRMFKTINPYHLLPKHRLNCQQNIRSFASCCAPRNGGSGAGSGGSGGSGGGGGGISDEVLAQIQALQAQINNLNNEIFNLQQEVDEHDQDHPHPAFVREKQYLE